MFQCANEAFALLQAAVAPGSVICILADGNREPLLLQPAFHEKELIVVGLSDGLDYPGYADGFKLRLPNKHRSSRR